MSLYTGTMLDSRWACVRVSQCVLVDSSVSNQYVCHNGGADPVLVYALPAKKQQIRRIFRPHTPTDKCFQFTFTTCVKKDNKDVISQKPNDLLSPLQIQACPGCSLPHCIGLLAYQQICVHLTLALDKNGATMFKVKLRFKFFGSKFRHLHTQRQSG